MPKESQNDFGRYLQACRLASGRSLEEVARQTKIIRSCLHQIENEEMQILPEAVFVKGFVRAYAEAVGGDAEEALRRYQNRCGVQQQIEQEERATSSGTRFWLRFLFVLLLFAGAVGMTFYAVRKVGSADTLNTFAAVVEGPSEIESPLQGSAATDTKDNSDEATAPSSTFNLRASAVAYTRLKIIADAGMPQEFELQPGEQIAVTAKKHFNLLIGNAGGIRLTLNDTPVAVPGKNSQVVTLNLP
jgi:cytoskeletal protein RodZ